MDNNAHLERDVEYAKYLVETAKQRPSQLVSKPTSTSSKGKSIHQKLLDLYIEECEKQSDDKNLLQASNLLPKLVKRDGLNCLILKLYPGTEGYSLMLKGRNGVESETFKLPYEASEFLDFVDASELPPFLVDLLERAQVNVFYSGCVILEVRDFRRSTGGAFETHYTMLKPTSLSLLSDIYNMSNDGHRWTQDDLCSLESQLLLTTEEPICLDPSPAVLLVANKLQFEKKKWNTPALKRSVKKYSQAAFNRKRKFAQASAPKELSLIDFLHRKRPRSNPPVNLKVGKPHVDMWQQKPVYLSTPESVDVEKFATAKDPPEHCSENIMELVEEHTLERDINQEKKLLAKLSINKRKLDDNYFGTLYLDHDYKEHSRGKTCVFTLGTRLITDKYLQQFKEIFTEEGRRAVKITTQKPGQPPHVEYTQTSSTNPPQAASATGATPTTSRQSLTSLAATLNTTQADVQIATTAAAAATGLIAGKRNVPIQLSLTLATPGVPGGANQPSQLQLNIKQPVINQSQSLSHRGKTTGHVVSGQRSVTNTPDPSPASTPTSAPAQLLQFPQGLTAVTSVHSSVKTPIPTPTPPSNTTITTQSTTSRKLTTGGDNPTFTQLPQGLQQAGNITFVQATEGNTGQNTQPVNQQPITNINIANIGLPPNIIQNIAGLQGVNLANLQNMQVSLSMAGGGIAVPVPISLINTNSGMLQNPTGIFVSSLMGNVASTGTTSSSGAQSSTAPSLVTMVTANPAVSSSNTTVTSATTSSGATTSGSNSTSVIHTPAGMLSLPIGLGPFVPGVKPQSGTNIRAPTSVPLLQIQGQQGLQILGLQQQRGQIKPGAAAITQQPGQPHSSVKPGSLQTTAVLMAQNIAGHHLKPGQQAAGTTTLQPQQLMQLQATPLTFNKQQPFTPIQLKPPTSQQVLPPSSKSKNKKRTTPTPPKP